MILNLQVIKFLIFYSKYYFILNNKISHFLFKIILAYFKIISNLNNTFKKNVMIKYTKRDIRFLFLL